MWQRLQTLYLAISFGLVLALCFGTAYHVADPDGMLSVSYWQLQKPYFGILLGILTGLVGLALAGMAGVDVFLLGRARFQLDRNFPPRHFNLQYPGGAQLLPGPANGGKCNAHT